MAESADPGQTKPLDEVLPVKIAHRGDWTVVRLEEASMMDVHVIEALHARVRDLLAEGHVNLVLDFKQVQYISSSMVGVLVATRQEVAKANGQVVLAALNDRLLELLRLTRLESMFVVEPDARTALKRVGAVE